MMWLPDSKASVRFCLTAILPVLLTTAKADPVVTTKIAKVTLSLEQQGNSCHIKNTSSSTPAQNLNLPWPCQFHTDKSGQPRIVRSGKFDYLLVEASNQAANSQDCDTQLRAVRAHGGKWQVSQYQDKVASCPPFQWDNMVFTALFK